jgi:hypothetical protein
LRSVQPAAAALWSARRRWPSPYLAAQQEQNFDGILTQGHDAFRRFGECLFIATVFNRQRICGCQSRTDRRNARPNAQMTFMKRYPSLILLLMQMKLIIKAEFYTEETILCQ